MAIPETVTVDVTVNEVALLADKTAKLICIAPLLLGPKKLPMTVFGCPSSDAPAPGETVRAILSRGKCGEKYDGTAYWHWSWRWQARAADGAPAVMHGGAGKAAPPRPAQAPAAAPAAQAPAQGAAEAPRSAQGQQAQKAPAAVDEGGFRTPTDFRREKALEKAVEWAIARFQLGEKISSYHICQITIWFTDAMEGRLPRSSKTEQALKAQGAVEVPAEGEPWEDIFKNEDRAA